MTASPQHRCHFCGYTWHGDDAPRDDDACGACEELVAANARRLDAASIARWAGRHCATDLMDPTAEQYGDAIAQAVAIAVEARLAERPDREGSVVRIISRAAVDALRRWGSSPADSDDNHLAYLACVALAGDVLAAPANGARVEIEFLATAAGGREQVPSGPTYATVARFEPLGPDERSRLLDMPWSFVVDLGDICAAERRAWGTARLLAPEAAVLLAIAGRRFTLFEGVRVVARGRVVAGAEGAGR